MANPEGSLNPEIELAFSPEQAENYLDTVRQLYRNNEADYRGRRSELQQNIANDAAEQADQYFDFALQIVMSIASHGDEDKLIESIPSTGEEKSIKLGGARNAVTLADMRDAWRRLWTGMSVMTNRLSHGSYEFNETGMQEISKLDEKSRQTVMQALFNQFQEINTYRFGVTGFGLSRTRRIHNEEGGVDEVKYDPDKARDDRMVSANAAHRRYVSNGKNEYPATHMSGKISPEELAELRKEFPEFDIDLFFINGGYVKNPFAYYRDYSEDQ